MSGFLSSCLQRDATLTGLQVFKMAAEVREAEQLTTQSHPSDSDSPLPGLLETLDIPGKSENPVLVASDYDDLTYTGITHGALPTVSTSGTIHTIKRKARRVASGTFDGDTSDTTDTGNESSNANDQGYSEVSGDDSQDDNKTEVRKHEDKLLG